MSPEPRSLVHQSGDAPAPYYEDDLITLYHGDCREILPVLLGDIPPLHFGAVVTDPPYGIKWRRGSNPARNSKPHGGILNDEDTSARDEMLAMTATLPAVVFGSFYAPHPPNTRQVLAWKKPPDAGVVGSTTGYRRDVEPVFLVGSWPVRDVEWSSLLVSGGSMAAVVSATGHPHTKPVPLMRDLIARCPIGTILDPFCGSGSTLRAAKDMGRRAVGIELDEDYCRTAVDRLAQEVMFDAA